MLPPSGRQKLAAVLGLPVAHAVAIVEALRQHRREGFQALAQNFIRPFLDFRLARVAAVTAAESPQGPGGFLRDLQQRFVATDQRQQPAELPAPRDDITAPHELHAARRCRGP